MKAGVDLTAALGGLSWVRKSEKTKARRSQALLFSHSSGPTSPAEPGVRSTPAQSRFIRASWPSWLHGEASVDTVLYTMYKIKHNAGAADDHRPIPRRA